MKTVIIGAGKEALHTIKKAKEQGLMVIAMDGDPDAAGLKEADKAAVVNISDEEETIAAVKEIKPDFLLTVPIGRYLTTTGAVNDALGLPGIPKEAAENCTDKWRFHQLLQQRGLRDTGCWLMKNRKDGEAFLSSKEEVRFPVILKPRYGSGSRGLFVAEDEDKLKEAFAFLFAQEEAVEEYILEECADGEEYGIDGAVIEGEFHLVLLRKKENTPFPARQAVAYFSVSPKDEFYRQVEGYLRETIAVLNLQECLVHGDIIRSRKGPFAIELSARPSGHNLHNLFTPLATGVDMAEEYIRYRMGKEYSFTAGDTKRLMIHYFDLEGRIERVPDVKEAEKLAEQKGCKLLGWECGIQPGEILEKVSDGHSLMGRGYVILEGKREGIAEEELKQTAEEIKAEFKQKKGR